MSSIYLDQQRKASHYENLFENFKSSSTWNQCSCCCPVFCICRSHNWILKLDYLYRGFFCYYYGYSNSTCNCPFTRTKRALRTAKAAPPRIWTSRNTHMADFSRSLFHFYFYLWKQTTENTYYPFDYMHYTFNALSFRSKIHMLQRRTWTCIYASIPSPNTYCSGNLSYWNRRWTAQGKMGSKIKNPCSPSNITKTTEQFCF